MGRRSDGSTASGKTNIPDLIKAAPSSFTHSTLPSSHWLSLLLIFPYISISQLAYRLYYLVNMRPCRPVGFYFRPGILKGTIGHCLGGKWSRKVAILSKGCSWMTEYPESELMRLKLNEWEERRSCVDPQSLSRVTEDTFLSSFLPFNSRRV